MTAKLPEPRGRDLRCGGGAAAVRRWGSFGNPIDRRRQGRWTRWYTEAIPRAEQLYEIYLKERAEEEEEASR
jgi:hypothetical protein